MALVSRQLELPQELKDVILAKKCVAFIGAGLSAGSYDAWPDLVNKLCERCGVGTRVVRDSPPDALLDAAQAAKDNNERAYYSYLGEHFGRPARPASLLYDAILSLPFECYLTVNIDPLLALKSRTARIPCATPPRAYPSLDRKAMSGRSIHYLHGYIEEGSQPEPGTIVLSREEFRLAYTPYSNLMNCLVQTFEFEAVVFIGCRLKEPAMQGVFSICKKHQQERLRLMERRRDPGRPPVRFILLAEPEVTKARSDVDVVESKMAAMKGEEAFYANMDIKTVWYQTCGEDHTELRFALERLAGLGEVPANHGWDGGIHAV